MIDTEQHLYETAREVLSPGLDIGTAEDTLRWQDQYLYSRASSVYGGSREIQLNVIAKLLVSRGGSEIEEDEERAAVRQSIAEAIDQGDDGDEALDGLDWWTYAAAPGDEFGRSAFAAWFEEQGRSLATSSALAGVRAAAVASELAAQPARPRDERAAYTCDLAVQVARDLTDSAGRPDRAALAATLANRSLVLAAAGKYAPALADLDEALTLAPQNAALHGNRGNLLLRLNRPVDALDAHDQAIALAPRDPAGYINRGFSHRALGNAVAAAEDVERARVLGASAAVRQPGNGAADAGRDR